MTLNDQPTTSRGSFIVLEGIDGSGKSTYAGWLKGKLEALGFEVRCSHEPNDDYPTGQKIKRMLRGEEERPAEPIEFQRLYVEDRQHDLGLVRSALADGAIYLMERYAHSTLAYGKMMGLSYEQILDLHREVIGPDMLWPDLTIILDLPVKDAIPRLAVRGQAEEYFEKMGLKMEMARQAYLEVGRSPLIPGRKVVVDAGWPIPEVCQFIWSVITQSMVACSVCHRVIKIGLDPVRRCQTYICDPCQLSSPPRHS